MCQVGEPVSVEKLCDDIDLATAAGLEGVAKAGTQRGACRQQAGVREQNQHALLLGRCTTSGSVELRRNGAVLLTFSSNTQGVPTGDISRVQLRAINQGGNNRVDVWLDDIVIADDLGGQNNDFPGDLRITTLVPTADTSQKDWSPSSGSNNFSRVAEIPPDDDTSWVASATAGDRDLYTMAPLGVTPLAIRGLQQTALARKDDAGDRALSLVLKSDTAVEVTPPAILGSGYSFIEHLHETDPATDEPWTPAAIDAVQAGIEVAP